VALTHAYTALHPKARSLHQLLVLIPGESFTVEAAAALVDLPLAQTQPLLDELVDQRLLTLTEGRYRQHSRARAHALEVSRETHEPQIGTAPALNRLLTWYLNTASAASAVLDPHHWRTTTPPAPLFTADRARSWFADEISALHLAVRLASEVGHPSLCWQLHEAMQPYLRLRRSFTLWQETVGWARAAARTSADPVGQALTVTSQATLARDMGDGQGAARDYAHALELWDRTGRMAGYAHTLIEYAHLEVSSDRCGRARLKFVEALELAQTEQDPDLELRAWAGLGQAELGQGRPSEALACLEQVVEAPSTAPGLRLPSLVFMAAAHLQREDPIRAAHLLQRADLLEPMVVDPVAAADVDLVRAHLHVANPQLHRTHLVRAYNVLRRVGDARADALQRQLDELGG
jgi:tetratricopeptide (TPR) repeat protein